MTLWHHHRMTTSARPVPPMNADERATLEGMLDFYRATLAGRCDRLTEEQLRDASVPPSPLTLLGLLQHAADVERYWFRQVLGGEDVPPIFGPNINPDHDGGFDVSEESSHRSALSAWQQQIDRARTHCAARSLDDSVPFAGGEVSLRWIYVHMVGEYARHCGHADLIRERIDGETGV
jgi:hypothetical protein